MSTSIDEFLGPAERRFFGEGFRSIDHEFRELHMEILPNDRYGVAGSASLSYPSTWSTKADRSDLKPHLSTVDAFVLAASLSDLLMIRQFSLEPNERASAWIRSVEFRAGSAPVESLDNVPVTASVASITRSRSAIDGPHQSIIDAVIGNIKIQLVVCHDVTSFVAHRARLADGIATLGERHDRFYGVGYKHQRHQIENLRFTEQDHALTASVSVTRWGGTDYSFDLGGAYRPSVSVLDCVIAQSQITQALLYSLDGLDRSETNTLWMRRVKIDTLSPYQPLDTTFDAIARVEKTQLLPIRGGLFRSTEFTGTFQGFTSRYSLAHELPASAVDASILN